MCEPRDAGYPQFHRWSRRSFLMTAGATGAAAIGAALLGLRPARAQGATLPPGTGAAGRRYVIRGGAVLSMDPAVGDFAVADVLVDGRTIVAVGPNLDTGGADVIEADGMIVMPGFIDTHHHQFETALRGFLADGLLFNDGLPHGRVNYFGFHPGQVRRRLSAGGRLHLRAVRLAEPARRWCDNGAGHLPDSPLAGAHGCDDRRARGFRPPRRVGLFRGARRGDPIPAGRQTYPLPVFRPRPTSS